MSPEYPDSPDAGSFPVDPFGVRSVGSANTPVADAEGNATETGNLNADPDSEWRTGPLPDEPTWRNPARTVAEALARAEATRAFWRAMMRAPYATGYRRKRRPLRTADLIRNPLGVGADLECERCGEPFTRSGRRGPVPRLCEDCRRASRNRPGR